MNKREILLILSKEIGTDIDLLMSLPESTKLVDIGLESMLFINFIVAFEERYGIEVLDRDLLLSNYATIEKLLHTLEKYIIQNIRNKKVLVCDCDNCLWHGISGEEEINIDAATVSLQRMIVELYDIGVLICLCSKNDPNNIISAFKTINMPLKWEHIIISKINYKDKATNIVEIANELKLSLDSFVFIDDSEYEIDLINSLLPEVEAINVNFTNDNIIEDIRANFNYKCCNTQRTQQYREQKEREKAKANYNDISEYNTSLNTIFCCDIASFEQADRIAEISQRTNQFNMSGARYTKKDIQLYISSNNYFVLSLSAKDRFGDMGIIGMAVVRREQKIIESFCISCRVLGRGFEKVLLDKIKELVGSELKGVFLKTEKNKHFQMFYIENGVTLYE